jgi:EAL domain-containing protein (putative c-di-GMP-specific phosphodiesterase class I)/GGDEF domain-containing protein
VRDAALVLVTAATMLVGLREPWGAALVVAVAAVALAVLAKALRVAAGAHLHDPELGIASREGVLEALGDLLLAGPATAVVILPDRLHELLAAIGRARSDALLDALAARLRGAAGHGAIVGRIAPSRLAVVLPGTGADDDSRVRRLITALDEPLVVDGVPYPVSADVGFACAPDDTDDATQLLERAEIAMHASGRGPQRYHPGIEQTARRRLAVLSDLERALSSGQLHLHFQPIVDLATGAVQTVEALVRWDHPEHGAMAPALFIPLAEETDLIAPLTEHVLALALDHCAGWRADGLALTVAVNLSGRNVADPGLPGRVAALLAARGLDGSALKLEITETVLMQEPEVALATLAQLRLLGVKLALDDFGTGYSSLAYLKDLPLDELKIDRSFVKVLDNSPRSAAVVRTIVALADELGLQTVAEGVEDHETLQRVAGLGCSMAQGFLFARPLSAQGLRLWLSRRYAVPQALVAARPDRGRV